MWIRAANSLCAAAIVLVMLAVPAHAQQVTYTGSVQYATGDYIFTERTTSYYLFNGFSLSSGRFTARVSVPIIMQNSPWISYSGAGVVPSGGPQQGQVNRRGVDDGNGQGDGNGNGQGDGNGQGHGNGHAAGKQPVVLVDTTSYSDVGLGDPMVHTDVMLLRDQGPWPTLRLVAGIKLPLADVDRGFGTGAWDVGGGVSLSKVLGRQLVFIDVMYWYLGDMEDLELKDPISYSVAIGRPLWGGKVGVLVSLSGYTEVIADIDPPIQAGLGLTYALGTGNGLSSSVAFGLTESTPDVSLSFGWRVAL